MKTSAFTLFLRTFFIQGSFNYRSLIGGGFLWALLPALRGTDGGIRQATLERHAEPFNSHPYLVGIATGAVARMEADGEDPETIRRFKEAVRSSLGSLGDQFFWAAVRPTLLVLALVAWVAGLSHWLIVAAFLIVYNVIHVGIRWWAVATGLREGPDVGSRLRALALGRRGARIVGLGAVGLGVLCGWLLVEPLRSGMAGWGASALMIGVFTLGMRRGATVVRPTRVTLVAVITFFALLGLA